MAPRLHQVVHQTEEGETVRVDVFGSSFAVTYSSGMSMVGQPV